MADNTFFKFKDTNYSIKGETDRQTDRDTDRQTETQRE